MSQRSTLIMAALSSSLLLAGCGSRETTPTLADEMRGVASEVQAQAERKEKLAAKWERGRREVSEGEVELREGGRLVAESERAFEGLRLPPPPASATDRQFWLRHGRIN